MALLCVSLCPVPLFHIYEMTDAAIIISHFVVFYQSIPVFYDILHHIFPGEEIVLPENKSYK